MDAAELVADRVVAVRRGDTRCVVGIAGAVAAGKSTFAASVATALERRTLPAEIVSTDGFLMPNARLAELGLVARKGFPESYDVALLRAVLEAVRAGVDGVHVRLYSHQIYDVIPGPGRALGVHDVLVLEGVNALGAAPDLLDVAVYLHADEEDLERWYVTRFLELARRGRDDPASFYSSMAELDDAQVEALARSTWRSVNLVNLRECIAPTADAADVVVVKAADHSVIEVREHAAGAGREGRQGRGG